MNLISLASHFPWHMKVAKVDNLARGTQAPAKNREHEEPVELGLCVRLRIAKRDCSEELHWKRSSPQTHILRAALSAPNHKSQIASDLKSRSPNRKNFPQIAVSGRSNRTFKSRDL